MLSNSAEGESLFQKSVFNIKSDTLPPGNRSQLERCLEIVARSRPIARWTGARFGHDPERVIDRRALRGRERRTRGRQKQRHSTW